MLTTYICGSIEEGFNHKVPWFQRSFTVNRIKKKRKNKYGLLQLIIQGKMPERELVDPKSRGSKTYANSFTEILIYLIVEFKLAVAQWYARLTNVKPVQIRSSQFVFFFLR